MREGIDNRILCILDGYIIEDIQEREEEERKEQERPRAAYDEMPMIPPDLYNTIVPPQTPPDKRGVDIIDFYTKNR